MFKIVEGFLVTLSPREVVVVGSTNKSKLLGVKRAWRLFEDAEVIGVEVEKAVSPQPVGWREVFYGSLQRALKASDIVKNAKYYVGVEAGLVPAPMPSGLMEIQVAVVVDRRGRVSVGTSSGFEIPYKMIDEVLSLRELGDVASEVLRRREIKEKLGIIGYLTRGIVTRVDLTFQATLNALLPRINARAYSKLYTVEEYERVLKEMLF